MKKCLRTNHGARPLGKMLYQLLLLLGVSYITAHLYWIWLSAWFMFASADAELICGKFWDTKHIRTTVPLMLTVWVMEMSWLFTARLHSYLPASSTWTVQRWEYICTAMLNYFSPLKRIIFSISLLNLSFLFRAGNMLVFNSLTTSSLTTDE